MEDYSISIKKTIVSGTTVYDSDQAGPGN
jgi:hypothetical protein